MVFQITFLEFNLGEKCNILTYYSGILIIDQNLFYRDNNIF